MKTLACLILVFLAPVVFADESGVKVDKEVETFMTAYCEYWSDGDSKKIISEIYGTPFTLYHQDKTEVMKTEKEVEGGFKLLAHKTSKEVVSGLTPQLDD